MGGGSILENIRQLEKQYQEIKKPFLKAGGGKLSFEKAKRSQTVMKSRNEMPSEWNKTRARNTS